MNRPLAFLFTVIACAGVQAQETATPIDVVPEPGGNATIACEYRGSESFRKIGMSEMPVPGLYHYELYLPRGYKPVGKCPLVFLMSARGKARADPLKGFADGQGWIVAALQEAKNGPWGPIMGNFMAAHDDVIRRCNIAEKEKFATGFSGGARGSSLFTQMRPGFRGLLLQGAGFAYDDHSRYIMGDLPGRLRVGMIMGLKDNNHMEAGQVKSSLPQRVRYRLWEWEGGHKHPPEELVGEALKWVAASGD